MTKTTNQHTSSHQTCHALVVWRERERERAWLMHKRKPGLVIKITFKIINNIKNYLKINLHYFVWNFDKYNIILNLQHSLYGDYSLSPC